MSEESDNKLIDKKNCRIKYLGKYLKNRHQLKVSNDLPDRAA